MSFLAGGTLCVLRLIYELCSIIHPKMLFLETIVKKPLYVYDYVVKIGFSEFSQKVSFLRHMLLCKSYINVVIAVILS